VHNEVHNPRGHASRFIARPSGALLSGAMPERHRRDAYPYPEWRSRWLNQRLGLRRIVRSFFPFSTSFFLSGFQLHQFPCVYFDSPGFPVSDATQLRAIFLASLARIASGR
jgi:hypothetical protein